MLETQSNIVFPCNCRGTHMNFVEPGKSNLVFCCGEYYGRYEDDDFTCLIYDLAEHKFYTDSWTTRGACSGDVFYKDYVNLNDATEEQLAEIREAAKKNIEARSETILQQFDWILKCKYYKSYSRKTRDAAFASITEHFASLIEDCDDIATLISLFYSGNYYNNEYRNKFVLACLDKLNLHIKDSINIRRKVVVLGEDFTGEVFWKRQVDGMFGPQYKIGIKTEDEKTVWAYIKIKEGADEGETVTLNGVVSNTREDEKYGTVINLKKTRRIDNVDPDLVVRETLSE